VSTVKSSFSSSLPPQLHALLPADDLLDELAGQVSPEVGPNGGLLPDAFLARLELLGRVAHGASQEGELVGGFDLDAAVEATRGQVPGEVGEDGDWRRDPARDEEGR